MEQQSAEEGFYSDAVSSDNATLAEGQANSSESQPIDVPATVKPALTSAAVAASLPLPTDEHASGSATAVSSDAQMLSATRLHAFITANATLRSNHTRHVHLKEGARQLRQQDRLNFAQLLPDNSSTVRSNASDSVGAGWLPRALLKYLAPAINKVTSETMEEVNWPVPSLRLLVWAAPIFFMMTFALCIMQSRHHLKEIMQGRAIVQHERALNIIALPAVYSVMCFSALARLYTLVTDEVEAAQEGTLQEDFDIMTSLAFARYETCLHIGDLYEAWALYQFGKLTCDLLEADFLKDAGSDTHSPSAAEAVSAVSSVMWVGSWLFIAVCFAQAGWTLFMWLFHPPGEDKDADSYQEVLKQFFFAGMVASAAAIYNVHVVERTFGQYIPGYAPLMKFLSVKILVFFAFWQGAVLWALNKAGILQFTDVQGRVFQVTLLIAECLLGAIVHWFAWDHREVWYDSDTKKDADAGSASETEAAAGVVAKGSDGDDTSWAWAAWRKPED
mmetsp:Transcript_13030/g.30443  ORF Transcript_13030/g.30443 Transcript_13030/m.30443 type:complete len:503 (-) Transcript_13030:113-1621(-)